MGDVEGTVGCSVAGGAATVTFERPAKRNALTTAMYSQLAACLRELADTADLSVVVFTGAPGAFTAGNDLGDMRRHPPTGDADPPVLFLDALVALPQVLVAAVDGPAVGIGTTLLAHMDLVYATEASVLAVPFVRLGLVPEAAASYLLPSLVGHQAAAEMLLLGRSVTAREAAAMGLVTEVVSDTAALDSIVAEVVATLTSQPAGALLETRRLLRLHREQATRERLDLDSAILRSLLPSVLAAR